MLADLELGQHFLIRHSVREKSGRGGHGEDTPVKEAWIHLDHWSKEMVTAAVEAGADALVVPAGCHERVKALGRITTVSGDGDLKPGVDVFFEVIESAEDQERIMRLVHRGPVVLMKGAASSSGGDVESAGMRRGWEVIPLENIVAAGGKILVPADCIEDIDLALGILEKGVAGVIIHPSSPADVRTLVSRVKAVHERCSVESATVESIQPAGLGDRVCVDTCSLMTEGEGLLVGNSSGFLFLVQAETRLSPYVAPRPFRINAGPVHAYTKVPGGRTRYLSELMAGDPVCVVDKDGNSREATVGRVKIERRPLLLIHADCNGTKGSILLQNAETIRLARPGGEAVSMADLAQGDSVLVSIEQAGRHFGMKVDETIQER